MEPLSTSSDAHHVWTVGAWIAARRQYLALTQDALAERVGAALEEQSKGKIKGESCNTRTIRNAEAGKLLSLRIARGLVQALNLPQDIHGVYINWFRQQPFMAPWHPADPRQNIPAKLNADTHATAPSTFTSWYTPPPAPKIFIGRTSELKHLHAILDTQHCSLITGIAGVGKSALATVFARQRYREEQIFWYRFHRNDDILILLWHLAAFLAAHGQERPRHLLDSYLQNDQPLPGNFVQYLRELLHNQSYLIFLEDVQLIYHTDEQTITPDPSLREFLERLWESSQHNYLELLTTAREPLDQLPSGASLTLDGLSANDVHTLLARRNAAHSPKITAALLAATEGNPALIELAIDVLKHHPGFLDPTGWLHSTPTIQDFLLREVDKSLTEPQREVLKGLAVMLGNQATRPSIEAVLGDRNVQRPLIELTRRQLVRVMMSQHGPTYQIRGILQPFYYGLLETDQLRTMHQRVGRFYETVARDPLLAARHYVQSGNYTQAARLTWLILSRGQARLLRALLEEFGAQSTVPPPSALILARCEIDVQLGEHALAEAGYHMALAQLDLEPNTAITSELKARTYRGLGDLYEFDAPQRALESLQRGLAEVAGSGVIEEAILYIRLGSVQLATNHLTEAAHALEAALRLLPPEAAHWRGRALVKQGVLHCMLDDFPSGLQSYHAALTIYRQINDDWGMIGVQHNLGIIKQITGNWPGADAAYQSALQTARTLGSIVREVDILLCLGALRTSQGAFDEAHSYLQQADAHAEHLQEQRIHILLNSADVAIRTADYADASAMLEEADQLIVAIGSDYQLPELRRAQALVALGQGDLKLARERVDEALEFVDRQSSPRDAGLGLRVRGQVDAAFGDLPAATAAFEQAYALLSERDPYEAARAQLAWGQALLSSNRSEGQALLQTALAQFQRIGARADEVLAEQILQSL